MARGGNLRPGPLPAVLSIGLVLVTVAVIVALLRRPGALTRGPVMTEYLELGLQRERTALCLDPHGSRPRRQRRCWSWRRHEPSFPLPVAIGLSVPWVLLALADGRLRRPPLRGAGRPGRPDVASSRVVVPLGISVGVLCAATALAIVFT